MSREDPALLLGSFIGAASAAILLGCVGLSDWTVVTDRVVTAAVVLLGVYIAPLFIRSQP